MQSTSSTVPSGRVRTRRAYFDCRFGQLHVRTAFPTTGGFDEGVTLVCLHPERASSRSFVQFLPEIANDRSVYAPDLPGCGESDAAPSGGYAEAAAAIIDLAADLRLRRIDVLGLKFGAGVALELGAARPDLVRRLVLVGAPPLEQMPVIQLESLVLQRKPVTQETAQSTRKILPRAKIVDLDGYTADLLEVVPKTLAKQIGEFLAAKT